MKKIRPEYIVFVQLAIIIVLAVLLFKSCQKEVVNPIVKDAKSIVSNVEKDESESKPIIDSLKAANDSLTLAGNRTKEDLEVAEQLVAELLNEPPPVVTRTETDSVALYSWIEKTRIENAKKDSIVRVAIYSKNQVIANKEKQIAEKDLLYSKLRMNADTLASNQTILESVNLGLNKKLRRNKTANKVLIGAAATLAAIVIIKK